jgi:hypothetical protein
MKCGQTDRKMDGWMDGWMDFMNIRKPRRQAVLIINTSNKVNYKVEDSFLFMKLNCGVK